MGLTYIRDQEQLGESMGSILRQWSIRMLGARPSTKKLTDGIDLASVRRGRQEFAIPRFGVQEGDGFIGLKTGKLFPNVVLVYTGTSVTVGEILARYCEHQELPVSVCRARAIIARYILALDEFTIGNVLSVEYVGDDDWLLEKVANRPPPLHKPRLP